MFEASLRIHLLLGCRCADEMCPAAVYALQGIRSMIERKMKELNTPSFARAIVNAASGGGGLTRQDSASRRQRDKGKGRAKPPPMTLQPMQNLGAAVQQIETAPLTPPPPYMRRRTSHQQITSDSICSNRGSPTVGTLRRQSSWQSIQHGPPPELLEQRRDSSATVVASTSQRTHVPSEPPLPEASTSTAGATENEPRESTSGVRSEDDSLADVDTDNGAASASEIEIDSDMEHETRPHQNDARGTFHTDAQGSRRRHIQPRAPEQQRGSFLELTRFLQEIDPPESQSGEPSSSGQAVQPTTRRRGSSASNNVEEVETLQAPMAGSGARSQNSSSRALPHLTARTATRDESSAVQDLAAFLRETDPPAQAAASPSDNGNPPSSPVRPRIPKSHTENSLASHLIVESASSLHLNGHASPSSSRNRLAPRPASMAVLPSQDLRELSSFLRDGPPPSPSNRPTMTRSASMAAPSDWEGRGSPIPRRGRDSASRPSSVAEGVNIPSSSSSFPNTGTNSPQAVSRQRKRWSGMLDNILRSQATSGSPASPPSALTRSSFSAPDLAEESQPPVATSSEADLSEVAVAGTSAGPALSERPSRQKINLPEEAEAAESLANASGLPNIDSGSSVKTERHSANSTTPMDYVKLARSKGTRLFKCVETSKRTFLAVLCGEMGERIELYTVSLLRQSNLKLGHTA